MRTKKQQSKRSVGDHKEFQGVDYRWTTNRFASYAR